MKVALISTYDVGRQPFGLASPAAWLRRDGHRVECLDLAVGKFRLYLDLGDGVTRTVDLGLK